MSPLIPQSLLSHIPDLYATEETKDPLCHVKLFTPDANWTWYVIELSRSDNDTCIGFVQGLEDELGYFSLAEIESLTSPLGLKVERDLYFNPQPLSSIRQEG